MGAVVSLCYSKQHSPVPNKIGVDPPDWADDERSGRHARDVVDKISKLCAPVTVDRSGLHTVNVFSADRLSEQRSLPPLFRRMSSITPPIEGTAKSLNEMWTEHRKELEVAIHKEKGKSIADTAPDLLPQEDRLRRRLSKLNMDMNVCRGDGNCLFRAVSQELWGTEDYHESVRRKAIRYMRENKEDFEPYLGEDFTQYTAKMERSGTWGDELTLRAICDVYGVIINVVSSEQLNWFLRYMPKVLKHVKELFLTYTSPVHYNTIRRKGSLRLQRASLSLTRKSIIQAAIDKAEQAIKEMASIPEGPSVVEQRNSANGESVSATPNGAPADQPIASGAPAASSAAVSGGHTAEALSTSSKRPQLCQVSPFQALDVQNRVLGSAEVSDQPAAGSQAISPEQQRSESPGSGSHVHNAANANGPSGQISASVEDGAISDNILLPGQVSSNENVIALVQPRKAVGGNEEQTDLQSLRDSGPMVKVA